MARKPRIPMIYWPTTVRWNLDPASKAVMGKKWCEAKRKEARRIEILEKAFGRSRPELTGILFGGPKQEWVTTLEEYTQRMGVDGEATLLVER